jgi:acyl-CoA synthetase (AMP-forming)/AMP-acid ligase II
MRLGLTHGLRRALQLRGDETGLVSGGKAFTWAHIVARIGKLAGALHALGVSDGERVALLAMNSHRSFECYFASIWAGGIVTPLNHRLSLREIAAQLVDAAPCVLLVDAQFLHHADALRAACPSITAVILADDRDAPPGVTNYENLLAAAPMGADAGREGDEGACLFYTGGTTGAAKGVLLSHENILANTVNFMAQIGLDEETVHLHCGPLFHVAAGVRLFSVTQAAGTHVMLPRFEPEEVLRAISDHRVTIATFVPTMLRALLDRRDVADFDLSSLRFVTYGAAPMPVALLREAMARLPHVRFVQSYGMTETSPIATMLGWRDHVPGSDGPDRLRSAGRAALLAEIRIVGPLGAPLPAGEAGEIAIKGPMVMRGYWRQPEATAQALRDGWMHSGDIGYLDKDGYLYVVDRIKDLIISGGENVYSQEVENVIASHPAVQECAVFGRPDSRWGESVHAVVVPKSGHDVTGDEIVAHCRALIAGFKCPKSVQIRSTPMPLSGANKILKTQLRTELLAAEASMAASA